MFKVVQRWAVFAGAYVNAVRYQGDKILLQLLKLAKSSTDVDEFEFGQLTRLGTGVLPFDFQKSRNIVQTEPHRLRPPNELKPGYIAGPVAAYTARRPRRFGQ